MNSLLWTFGILLLRLLFDRDNDFLIIKFIENQKALYIFYNLKNILIIY